MTATPIIEPTDVDTLENAMRTYTHAKEGLVKATTELTQATNALAAKQAAYDDAARKKAVAETSVRSIAKRV